MCIISLSCRKPFKNLKTRDFRLLESKTIIITIRKKNNPNYVNPDNIYIIESSQIIEHLIKSSSFQLQKSEVIPCFKMVFYSNFLTKYTASQFTQLQTLLLPKLIDLYRIFRHMCKI